MQKGNDVYPVQYKAHVCLLYLDETVVLCIFQSVWHRQDIILRHKSVWNPFKLVTHISILLLHLIKPNSRSKGRGENSHRFITMAKRMKGQRRCPEDVAQVVMIIFPRFLLLGCRGQGVNEFSGFLHHLPVHGSTFERMWVVQLAAAQQFLLLVFVWWVHQWLMEGTSGHLHADPCTHPTTPRWCVTLCEASLGITRAWLHNLPLQMCCRQLVLQAFLHVGTANVVTEVMCGFQCCWTRRLSLEIGDGDSRPENPVASRRLWHHLHRLQEGGSVRTALQQGCASPGHGVHTHRLGQVRAAPSPGAKTGVVQVLVVWGSLGWGGWVFWDGLEWVGCVCKHYISATANCW